MYLSTSTNVHVLGPMPDDYLYMYSLHEHRKSLIKMYISVLLVIYN